MVLRVIRPLHRALRSGSARPMRLSMPPASPAGAFADVDQRRGYASAEKEAFVFQAHTQKLLNIVSSSLYSDKSVFIRELVSNASDALEKLRYLQQQQQQQQQQHADADADADADKPKIQLACDPERGVLVLEDNGIGMTRDELVENLGIIANSGSRNFVDAHGDKAATNDNGIIGQFGVGFYSVFMVADAVKVYTRKAGSPAAFLWESKGTDAFTIADAGPDAAFSAPNAHGTRIEIQLKPEHKQFSEFAVVKDLVLNTNNFISFPVYVDGEHVNTVDAIWTQPPSAITRDQHEKLYRFLHPIFGGAPAFHFQYRTDAPLDIKALLYFPAHNIEKNTVGGGEPRRDYANMSLYCKKILIKSKMDALLPGWLRFVSGVVDSADIPLNISRELIQDTGLVRRLNDILTGKVLRFLAATLKKDREAYAQWYGEFSMFLKEGACSDNTHRADLASLLLYASSATETTETTETDAQLVSLNEYVAQMPEDQPAIYYAHVPNRAAAEASAYVDKIRAKGHAVLYLYEAVDEFVMLNLESYAGKPLVSATSSMAHDADAAQDARCDEDAQLAALARAELGDAVRSVKLSYGLSKVAGLVVDNQSAVLRKMIKTMDPGFLGGANKFDTFELNPEHDLLAPLRAVQTTQPQLARAVIRQTYNNALLSAGLMDDATSMLADINALIRAALHPNAASSRHDGTGEPESSKGAASA